MKQIIKLRESEIRRMIAESVKRVLNEDQHFNSEGFITQTIGLDTFYGVYDEWMPNIESWEEKQVIAIQIFMMLWKSFAQNMQKMDIPKQQML